MKFAGQITLPSGFIAGYHEVTDIRILPKQRLLQLHIRSWGNKEAAANGYTSDRQIASIAFSEIPGLVGMLTALKTRLLAEDGPLFNTAEEED